MWNKQKLGPGPMPLSSKFRDSVVRAWSWPKAAATGAAPSSPQSVVVKLADNFKRCRGVTSGQFCDVLSRNQLGGIGPRNTQTLQQIVWRASSSSLLTVSMQEIPSRRLSLMLLFAAYPNHPKPTSLVCLEWLLSVLQKIRNCAA